MNATDIPLQGVVIGNGMYNMKLQYPTLNKIAFANGLIDERVAAELETRQKSCIDRIDADPAHAGDYCENVTVRWLYSVDGPAGELFYYDIGLSDGSFFDTLTARMAKYLNRQDVREALHTTTGQRWTQSDERAPWLMRCCPTGQSTRTPSWRSSWSESSRCACTTECATSRRATTWVTLQSSFR